MATHNLGRVAYADKGAYNSSTTYINKDVVQYNNGSYVLQADTATGIAPTNTSYWTPMQNPTTLNQATASANSAADNANQAAEAASNAIEAFNTLLPHEHFSTAQIERVEGEVTNKEYWFFVNARWDEETRRFKRIDIGKNSFGIQMQAAGTYPGEETLGYIDNQAIGYWRAIGRDYFLAQGDTANAAAVTEDIGTMIGDEWREFGVYLGWNNCFMLDSYGGMTIGGAGFEIDGNGIFPYSRVSMCKHEDTPGAGGYAFMGTLWNAYHKMDASDDESQCDYSVGLKAPIDYNHGGVYNAYSSFANMDEASFVIMRRPAGAAHDANTFKPVYEFDMDGNLHIDSSIYIEVDATVFDSTSAQIMYPESLNMDNLEIVRAYAVTESGNVEVTITTVNKTQYGVLFGYSADVAVSEMKVVCANAENKRTINLLSIQDDIAAIEALGLRVVDGQICQAYKEV